MYDQTVNVSKHCIWTFNGQNISLSLNEFTCLRCLVYICIIKGITENPKIIYITAIYPYVVLIVFFFRAVTLEGMSDGVIHLFKPKVRNYSARQIKVAWERL